MFFRLRLLCCQIGLDGKGKGNGRSVLNPCPYLLVRYANRSLFRPYARIIGVEAVLGKVGRTNVHADAAACGDFPLNRKELDSYGHNLSWRVSATRAQFILPEGQGGNTGADVVRAAIGLLLADFHSHGRVFAVRGEPDGGFRTAGQIERLLKRFAAEEKDVVPVAHRRLKAAAFAVIGTEQGLTAHGKDRIRRVVSIGQGRFFRWSLGLQLSIRSQVKGDGEDLLGGPFGQMQPFVGANLVHKNLVFRLFLFQQEGVEPFKRVQVDVYLYVVYYAREFRRSFVIVVPSAHDEPAFGLGLFREKFVAQ